MKTRFGALGLALIIACSLAIPVDAAETAESLEASASTHSLLYTAVDEQGNVLGPSDFTIANGKTYVLNTANNTVFQYSNNKQVARIALDDIDVVGTKVCADDTSVFVLDNTLSVVKLEAGKNKVIGSAETEMDLDTAVGFNVDGNKIYVSEPTPTGGKTHVYHIDSDKMILEETVDGYMVDENTFYRTEIISQNGENAGHACVITVMDANGNTTSTISLKSDNYIAGAQYMGKNDAGQHVIKQIDMVCFSDGTCEIEETLRTVNANNAIVSCIILPETFQSMGNQAKVIEDDVILFSENERGVSVDTIDTEKLPLAASFQSSLTGKEKILSEEQINAANSQSPVSPAALTSISRSAVIADAKAYHSSFTWTCAAKNLAALSNWRCPRYVSGAGTYSYMPYCWGGFSTTAQFRDGLSGSGRVGNINSSTGTHVYNTYGLDCSGYVSRCWRQSTKYGTGTIGNICTTINYSQLKSADALNKSGSHIVLYEYADGSGNYVLYEATTLNQYDRVSHTLRSISNLSSGGYVALRYNGITG